MEIYPSLISADLLNLEKVITDISPYCDGLHIDVMDDHFVPNLTWGPDFVNAIASKSKIPLSVHLMVDNPATWLDRLQLRPKDYFIFHLEAVQDAKAFNAKALINDVKKKGFKVGIAINPDTGVEAVKGYDVDEILLMSVQPGFSGQKFIPAVKDKVKALQGEPLQGQPLQGRPCVSMDGGIGSDNLRELSDLGVSRVAIASAIFSSDDPVLAIKNLKQLCNGK